MALNEFIQRLQGITNEGSRETDFRVLQSQRDKQRQAFLDQLALQQQQNTQFNVNPGSGQQQQGGAVNNANGLLSMYPLKGKLRVSSPYGVHREGHKSAHTGIDWASAAGTPIYAPGNATVRSTLFNKIYGNQTILDLGGGRSLMFGHQSGFGNIKPGQSVKAGQLIGYVGSTGWSTGPHLHFETWMNNKPVNPLSWFM